MRGLARHLADTDIDAGLAEIDRLQLRMRIGHVQDACIAEALEVVDARRLGGARGTDDGAGQRGARHLQKIPAADFHVRNALSKQLSGFPCPSSGFSRWSPDRSMRSPAPRLPWLRRLQPRNRLML